MEIGDKYQGLSKCLKDFSACSRVLVINAYADILRSVVDLSFLQMLRLAGWEKLRLENWHDFRNEPGEWGGCFLDLTESGQTKVEELIGDEVYYISGLDQTIKNTLFATSLNNAITLAEKRLINLKAECSRIKNEHGVETGLEFWLAQIPEELKPYLQLE